MQITFPKQAPLLTWAFPLSPRRDVHAEIVIHGAASIGRAEFRALREYIDVLARIERPESQCQLAREHLEVITPCDLVQLRPSADPRFGGLIMRATKVNDVGVYGYLLVPWRSGSRCTWRCLQPAQLARVGRVRWPEAEWGFTPQDAAARRQMWF